MPYDAMGPLLVEKIIHTNYTKDISWSRRRTWRIDLIDRFQEIDMNEFNKINTQTLFSNKEAPKTRNKQEFPIDIG